MRTSIVGNQKGAFAIITGLIIFGLIGFIALSIDIANLLVAKNELQNAADAAALAGAQVLYNDAGTQVNSGANLVAYNTAVANRSQGIEVDISDYSSNTGDVQRGHWSFSERRFQASDATEPPVLWDVTTDFLDTKWDFVNAVQVIARRDATPVAAFFSRIFGHENFQLEAMAVAWLGYAGSIEPGDTDQPISVCAQAITMADEEYTCTYGRMINSGQNAETHNSGSWVSLIQSETGCNGGTNANAIKDQVCGDGNPDEILFSEPIEAIGGNVTTALSDLIPCWVLETDKKTAWEITLPVIDCPGNNVSPCSDLKGVVTLNIIWITSNGKDPHYKEIPVEMGSINERPSWSQAVNCSGYDLGTDGGREQCWDSFAQNFGLRTVENQSAPYLPSTIYYLPDCSPHEPTGSSGSNNYGHLAKRPVLVD